MTTQNRRSMLQLGSALAAGALSAFATGSGASASGKPLFAMAGATIPVVGSDPVFPVRRVY
ncbi:hypothetical protein [Variovorax rhizosphaerae]|uniref:Uncharacterized protein n=1 Tax=Variovorax rhizosphaerae TaxID=1836200 RepID=A0ABU8WWA0_9BURK